LCGEKYLTHPRDLATKKIHGSVNFKAKEKCIKTSSGKRGKYKTLNYVNISASRQNIKNLNRNFEAIHVRIMHANFQVSCFIGVGEE